MVRSAMAQRHIRRGNAARDAQRWAEARAEYEHAVTFNPVLDHIWVQLGHSRKEMGDLRGAETAYSRALALKPDKPDTHLQLGHLLKVAGRLDDAVTAYAKAASLDPGLADAGRELYALGHSPAGTRMFGVAFEGPHGMRRSGGALRFDVEARLHDIDAAEVLRLVAQRQLRAGYRLHGASSGSPVALAGHATVERMDHAVLLCRFMLPAIAFGAQPLRLLYVNMEYEGLGSFEEWGQPGAWLAVGRDEEDLFGH